MLAGLNRAMPHERLLYFGDSKYAPYGTKTPDEVLERCEHIMGYFLEHDVKAVVIACNTATSVAAPALRKRYNMPIIGMEPALKLAVDRLDAASVQPVDSQPTDSQASDLRPSDSQTIDQQQTDSTETDPLPTDSQRIVVAATPLTLHEQKFHTLLDRYGTHHQVIAQPCPKLVEIVESRQLDNHNLVQQVLREYFDVAINPPAETVVLGCTHFTFYKHYLRTMLDPRTTIIDGNEGTIKHTQHLLEQAGLLAPESQQGTIEIHNSQSSDEASQLSHALFTMALQL